MATNTLSTGEDESTSRILTFAVIDIETTGLPSLNSNRASITELCIYAFDSKTLKQNGSGSDDGFGKVDLSPVIPAPPRVLHKLNLLFRPGMLIHPMAEQFTGKYCLIIVINIWLAYQYGFLSFVRPGQLPAGAWIKAKRECSANDIEIPWAFARARLSGCS